MKEQLKAICLASALLASPIFAMPVKSTQAATQQMVNINHADVATLQTLHGIGAAKAKAIVAYRESHGAFKKMEDLNHVHGISEKLIKRIQLNNPGRIKLSS